MDVGRNDFQFPRFGTGHGLSPVLEDAADDLAFSRELFPKLGQDRKQGFSQPGFFKEVDAAQHAQMLIEHFTLLFFDRPDIEKKDLGVFVFPADADFIAGIARDADLELPSVLYVRDIGVNDDIIIDKSGCWIGIFVGDKSSIVSIA